MNGMNVQTSGARRTILRILKGASNMNDHTEKCRADLKKCRAKINDPIFNEADELMKLISSKIEKLYSIASDEAAKRGMAIDMIEELENDGAGEINATKWQM